MEIIEDHRQPELGVAIVGRISEFGGPNDLGMTPTEGLALYPGLGRELNPDDLYCAMRWNYTLTSKEFLKGCMVIVTKFIGDSSIKVACKPVDWGPNAKTGRLIDISPGAMKALKAKTDDIVQCMLVKL